MDRRRAAFRATLAGPRCVFPISVYDPLSARIADDLGFETMMLGGSVASMVLLGAPDLMLITATEFAGLAGRIAAAGTLPLLVDADHGYGNALNVRRTVGELDRAGIAALTIEDTDLPPPFGEAGLRLLTIDEGAAKMRAALDGRTDPDLAIIARTDAPRGHGADEAIARARAYQAAGVDAIAFVGVGNEADLDAVCAAVSIPIMLGGLAPNLVDAEALAHRGVRICLRGHQPHLAALHATYQAMRDIKDGVAPAVLAGLPSAELVKNLTRADVHAAHRDAFLGHNPDSKSNLQ